MTYNLAKYKFQIGTKVKMKGAADSGQYARTRDGETTALWDFSKGNSGSVANVWKPNRGNNPPWLFVTPDPGQGFGVFVLAVSEVEKI